MVATKATFDIKPEENEVVIADKQEPVYEADKFRGDPQTTGLEHPSDFALEKPNVDILLDAMAFSPGEKPVTEMIVGFSLGPVKKFLKIVGNRWFDKFLGAIIKTDKSTFTMMPITYERAYGGWQELEKGAKTYVDIRNPAGTGYFRKRWAVDSIPLPNIEYAAYPTKKKPKKNRIAGFGPIASHWSPRIEYAGTYNENPEVFPNTRPANFDSSYFQLAPADQQAKIINGAEEAVLYNLHPKYREIRFSLPEISISYETYMDLQNIHQEANLQTIVIQPDQLKLHMVWQGNVICQNQGETLDYTKISYSFKKPSS